jgi:prepilin-type N-terminal cleavage/methylation domain-containing protein
MRDRAFTLIELLVVIAIISLLISILMPALGKAREAARALKDSTQVRGIHQGLVIWGQSHDDAYPLPSTIDRSSATVEGKPGLPGDPGESAVSFVKDNTGNVLSILIFHGYVPPALMVSPAEQSFEIEVDQGYQLAHPPQALVPESALWDPGFAGVPNEAGSSLGKGRRSSKGNTSYAHAPPFGKRKRLWTTSYNSNEAVLGNRGPLYGGSPGNWVLAPGAFGVDSITLKIHGGPQSWEGNVAYNDGRVTLENRPDPPTLVWAFMGLPLGAKTRPDNIFVNEDDVTGNWGLESTPGTAGNSFIRPYYDVQDQGGVAVVKPRWD